jgi:hypothetical protein
LRNKENRTDRILILIALIILLTAGGLFYFDSWMWGGKRDRGDVIGLISQKSGDVRLKLEGDLKWSRAGAGDNLVYNDAVYAGSSSEAQLNLGESKMTVTENTLVVLRREANVNFLNLNYGTLFGKVAKTDKIVIDTGNGKQVEFSTADGANIILHKVGNDTQLEVTSGTADVMINGKKRTIDSSDKVLLSDKVQVSKAGGDKLKIIRPLKDQVIYSEGPAQIDFAWMWEVPRLNRPDDLYKLEFSTQPTFSKLHAQKEVKNAFTTALNASQSLNLYFRVKGPGGAVSPTERVRFVRIHKPVIVHPVAGQAFPTPSGQSAAVAIEFKRPQNTAVWYQVAADPDFKSVLINQSTPETKVVTQLALGDYFVRARGDFGERMTDWTSGVPFRVEPLAELRLTRRPPNKIIIPNRNYPARFYSAPESQVRGYLAGIGMLRDFFQLEPDTFDEVKVQFENGGRELITQSDGGWPTDKLRPSRYVYQYMVGKAGHRPSAWSGKRRLEITMEAPRPIGEAEYGEVDAAGQAEARWDFTPLLFAHTYDIEVANEPGFSRPLEFKTASNVAKTQLSAGDAYFWRARARDRQGRIISEFSEPYRLKPLSYVPRSLAQNDRKPQAAERVRTKVERVKEDDWIHNGWWAWVGSGTNWTKYDQSVPGGSTFSTKDTRGPSQYLEAGYTGDKGWGGVFSYKNTPGKVALSGADINDEAYVFESQYAWKTISLEGIMRKLSSLKVFGRPILMGFRVGAQQHQTPYVHVNAIGRPELKSNEMTTASLGVLAELNRRRWNYYWLMRYQYPLSTNSDGASQWEIEPTFAFDGSLGVSYSLTPRTKLGFFWYGQWHQYGFTYSDGAQTNSGFQSLFYSNADLRLGIDF